MLDWVMYVLLFVVTEFLMAFIKPFEVPLEVQK